MKPGTVFPLDEVWYPIQAEVGSALFLLHQFLIP